MQKTKLFIDFDGTLFSTQQFRADIFIFLESVGYGKAEIEQTYSDECKTYRYSIRANLKRLADIKPCNDVNLNQKMHDLYKKAPAYLYEDAINFLNSIDRSKYEVNMLSLGDIEFQSEKINNSGITELFDNVYITDQQKWEFLQEKVSENEKFILVDDRADTCAEVAEKFPLSLPIRIFHHDFDINDPYLGGEYKGVQINSLTEAIQYL